MKTYIAIVLGIIVLFAVVFAGYKLTSNKTAGNTTGNEVSQMAVKKVTGEVKRWFEGDNILSYAFNIPETATTSIQMDGGLIKVISETGAQANVYFSYEGGRGFSANDYLVEKVAPQVAVVNFTGTTTIGMHEWTTAESSGSEWFIAPARDGEWLVVVEAKKTMHDETLEILKQMDVK